MCKIEVVVFISHVPQLIAQKHRYSCKFGMKLRYILMSRHGPSELFDYKDENN